MKRYFILAAIIASLCYSHAADSNIKSSYKIHEHRGFFFSAGIGFSRMTANINDDDEYYDYEGFGAPAIESKLGISIANLFVLNGVFSMTVYNGKSKYTHKRNKNTQYSYGDDGESEKTDSYALGEYAGIGFSVYPFRSPNSLLNGFHIGVASGFFATDFYVYRSKKYDEQVFDCGVGTEIEIGKDWWISETWSIGMSASYMIISSLDGNTYSGEGNRIQLLFRITRG